MRTERGPTGFRFTSFVSLLGVNESVSYEVFRAQPAAAIVHVWLRLRRSAASAEALGAELIVSILDSEVHTAVVSSLSSAWHWRRISLRPAAPSPDPDSSVIVNVHGTRIDLDRLVIAENDAFAPRDELLMEE